MNIFGALNTTSACELMASNCSVIEINRKIYVWGNNVNVTHCHLTN